MANLKILTVSENDDKSDEYAAIWSGPNKRWVDQSLCVSVSADRVLQLTGPNRVHIALERFNSESIDMLIEYLQEAKTFLEEQDMVDMIMRGKMRDYR